MAGKTIRVKKNDNEVRVAPFMGPFSEGVGWVQNDNKNDNETIAKVHFLSLNDMSLPPKTRSS